MFLTRGYGRFAAYYIICQRLERSIHLRNSNTGVNIDVTMQSNAKGKGVSGVKRTAIVFAYVQEDPIIVNCYVMAEGMSPKYKSS